jgi:class 3 adenylate cyclase/tetratricopeptide (TPR) repeat protein
MSACPECGELNSSRARFCRACGAELTETRAQSRSLRKTVTVLFCDVVRSTQLGEAVDAEAVRQVMSAYFDAMQEVIERHGGVVEKFIGDEVMAVFGVPTVHEDDALRAVRAATEMRSRLETFNAELEPDLGIRIEARFGVNTGAVVAGDPATGSTFVTGDAVNIAKRLEQAARPGEILIGTATYPLVKDAVTVGPRETFQVKGKEKEISRWRLDEVDAEAAGVRRRLDAPIVDRKEELARMRAAFESAASNSRCRLLTVIGAPGIGKSRLARELLDRLAGQATGLTGRCLPYGEGITFWPLAEIVDQAGTEGGVAQALRGETDGDLVAEHVNAAIGRTDAAGGEETFWAVRRYFEALARRRPLVVCLEDIHWATPRFLDLVEYVASWTRDAPVLLLCLAREDLFDLRPDWAAPRANAETFALEPLPPGEAELLLDEASGDTELSPETRAWIARTAEGNPLFVEQLVAAAAERGENGNGMEVPPTIQALLAARLDRLSPGERAVIERGAVIGKQFLRRAVVDLSSLGEREAVSRWLMALVRKELIRPDPSAPPGEDGLEFRHALIRDAAYDAMLKEQRAELHERFARWCDEHAGEQLAEPDAIVGYHLEQAYRYRTELGVLDAETTSLGESAGRRLGRAGVRAFKRDDMQAAAALLRRSVELLPEGDADRLEQLRELGQALREAGRGEDAVAAIARLRTEAGAAGAMHLEALAELELVAHAQLAGADSAAVQLAADRAIEACTDAGDELGLARAWRRVSAAHRRAGKSAAGERAAAEALVHAQAAGDRQEEARVVDGLCNCLLYGPTPADQALTRCAELLKLARGMPSMEANVLGAVAGLEAMRDRMDEAHRAYERASTTYLELGLLLPLAALTQIGAPLELLADDPVAAELEARRGDAIFTKAGSRAIQAPLIAEALLAQGRDDDAEGALGQLDSSSPGLAPWQVKWRTTRARLDARLGEHTSAENRAREATRLADATDDLSLAGEAWLALTEVLRTSAQEEEARQAGDEAGRRFERKGNAAGVRLTTLALASRS